MNFYFFFSFLFYVNSSRLHPHWENLSAFSTVYQALYLNVIYMPITLFDQSRMELWYLENNLDMQHDLARYIKQSCFWYDKHIFFIFSKIFLDLENTTKTVKPFMKMKVAVYIGGLNCDICTYR